MAEREAGARPPENPGREAVISPSWAGLQLGHLQNVSIYCCLALIQKRDLPDPS